MDLTTRCPRCGSIFSVSLEQLQLRKGYIRCVECANIFDGYEAVVPGGDTSAVTSPPASAPVKQAIVASDPVHPAPAPVMPSVLRQRPAKAEPVFTATVAPAHQNPPSAGRPDFSVSTAPRDAGHALRQDPVFRVGHDAPIKPDPVITLKPNPKHMHGDNAGRPAEPRVPIYIEPRSPADHDDDAQLPEFLGRQGRYDGAIKLFWGVLTVAGLLLLLAQLAYVYRAQIANQIPALRPALSQACESLHCKVAYSRRIDQISIMTSSLRADPGATGAAPSMTLHLTLRNTYDKPQEWPTLVLDLTDFSGTVVVRKNLAPANYLSSEALQQPFAASSEITVGVPIVLNDLKINGYQLGKFFP